MLSPKKLEYYQKNPAAFISEALDDYPRWEKQTEIIESVRDYRNTYVKACHGVGKTFTAKDVVLWFLYCFYPSKVITTAPSWAQVEKLLWSEINGAFKNSIVPLGGKCLKTSLQVDPEWFAIGISPKIDTEDDGKRLTGFHSENLLVIFDEAPAVNEKLWEIKETLMTSKNVKFLGIGNPVADNGSFFEGFRDETVNKISMNIFNSPNFVVNNIKTVEDLEEIGVLPLKERTELLNTFKVPYRALTTVDWAVDRLLKWGKNSPIFYSRVIGEFPATTTDTIISLASIELCKDTEPTGTHQRCLGVDVARFGNENTCFYGYENYRPIYKQKWNGQDTVQTANTIKNMIINERYKTIVIDDTGVGGGVTDQLRDFVSERNLNVEVIAVNFAQKSYQEEYGCIVTEMYYTARDFIHDRIIKIDDDGDLFSELSSRKYKFNTKGQFKIESKDDYKKRTGKQSPDEGDAFVLCCWGIFNKNRVSNLFGVSKTDRPLQGVDL